MATNDPGAGRAPDSRGAHDRDATHRPTDDRTGTDHRAGEPVAPADRKTTVARERDVYGGVKVGSAFFGWLTATGMAVLLTALLAAIGAGVGLNTTEAEAAEATQGLSVEAIGWIGAVLVIVVVFLAYYCGGYVAGRMARFDGARQGVAVFVWAIVVAIIVAVLGAIGGAQFDVLGQLNSFPRLPAGLSDLNLPGVVALIGVLVAALVGAVLGGIAGMHFHRKVDKVGLGR